MSFEVTRWPLPDDIDGYQHGCATDFPIPYAGFPNRTALRPALEHPDDHVPPQGDAADDKAAQLRFDADALNKQQAIQIVRQQLLPALAAQ